MACSCWARTNHRETANLYSISTNGIFVPKRIFNVRSAVWAPILVSAITIGGTALALPWNPVRALLEAWWVLPFAASFGSVLLLAAAAVLGQPGRLATHFSTRVYLFIGPAFALINTVAFLRLATSPPTWVEYLMPVFLLVSAWFYYEITPQEGDEREEPGRGGSPVGPPTY